MGSFLKDANGKPIFKKDSLQKYVDKNGLRVNEIGELIDFRDVVIDKDYYTRLFLYEL